MTTSDCRYGFRIVGGCFENRRLVDAAAALSAHAAADPRCEPDKECYLSAFWFDKSFRRHLEDNQGSTAGYSGPCWSPWLWFDLDAEELHYAHQDAGALAAFLAERYAVEPGDLLLFLSGSKGFHVGLPTALWSPPPSPDFHRTARHFAEHAATLAAVAIDAGVYDRLRAFRAPNSWHPKTGLHKRRLSLDELLGPLDAILELAKAPQPFDVPAVTKTSDQAAADWKAAVALVAREGEAAAKRRADNNGNPILNRSTLSFIRDGAEAGGHGTVEDKARGAGRHRLLYSAAKNLAEFGCPSALAHALLSEAGLDSGLPPREVHRQIECGLAAIASAPTRQDAPEPTQTAPDDSTVKKPSERNTSDSGGFQGQSCQQVTGATESTPADLKAALARLWAGQIDSNNGTTTAQKVNATTLMPLPPGAVGSGKLDKPCKCGSTQYVELPISEGRTRRDCPKCGRFAGWGRWYDQGGPTP